MRNKNLLKLSVLCLVLCVCMILSISATWVIAQTNSNTNGNVNSNTNTSIGPTVNFLTNKTTLTAGESATLTWSTSGASTCTASGGWTGSKSLSGTQAVSLLVNTTYTLTCKKSTGQSTVKSVIITVTALVKFIRGDVNRDKVVDIKDIETLGKAVDQLRPMPVAGNKALISACQDAADANDDGKVDVNDATKLIDLLFGSKKALPVPGSTLGYDSTSDSLGCTAY